MNVLVDLPMSAAPVRSKRTFSVAEAASAVSGNCFAQAGVGANGAVFNGPTASPQCCPQFQFLASGPSKRVRQLYEQDATMVERKTPEVHGAAPSMADRLRQSQFPELPADLKEIDAYVSHQAARKRLASSSSSSSSSSASSPSAASPPVFSSEDVVAMLAEVLAARDAKLRLEYDAVLADRLREQFEVFTRFNQDYISRQMRASDFSYLS